MFSHSSIEWQQNTLHRNIWFKRDKKDTKKGVWETAWKRSRSKVSVELSFFSFTCVPLRQLFLPLEVVQSIGPFHTNWLYSSEDAAAASSKLDAILKNSLQRHSHLDSIWVRTVMYKGYVSIMQVGLLASPLVGKISAAKRSSSLAGDIQARFDLMLTLTRLRNQRKEKWKRRGLLCHNVWIIIWRALRKRILEHGYQKIIEPHDGEDTLMTN